MLQLAITPQPRVNGEYLTVQAGSQLAVKVEGVIQHGSQPGRFRSVSGVVLNLSSQLTSRSNAADSKVCIKHYIYKEYKTMLYILLLSRIVTFLVNLHLPNFM